jgi:hypothetical protein
VDVGFGGHGHEERDFVHVRGEVWEGAADPAAASAVLAPIEWGTHQVPWLAGGGFDVCAWVKALAAAADQFGFVIEQVALAGAAVHEELDDAACARAVVEATIEIRGARKGGCLAREQTLPGEQLDQRDGAEAAAEAPQEIAS